jgi:uncharacterized OB-fold protein
MTESKNIRKGNGHGFIRDDGKIAMVKCFECGRVNYAPAVYSGHCAWCGYDANTGEQPK